MSRPPSASAAAAMAARHDASSVTSHSTAMAPGPASRAAAWVRSSRRASSATSSPRLASPTPMQRPNPLEAPMTTVFDIAASYPKR
ncbi:hypothetical protein I547_4514 [Mycobacterium kansasii 824]|nr:hypothetical protein I547_4514 [Mycobacterium kansasii 824]